MITLHDLDEAIAACQGELNPKANTALKLAAFLTIKREMFGESPNPQPQSAKGYSFAPEPQEPELQETSDFLRKISGMDRARVFEVMDELMSVLQATNPRLYAGVMRKFGE